jgi:hypothetical protein
MGYADTEESPMTLEKFAAGVCLLLMLASLALAVWGRLMGTTSRDPYDEIQTTAPARPEREYIPSSYSRDLAWLSLRNNQHRSGVLDVDYFSYHGTCSHSLILSTSLARLTHA